MRRVWFVIILIAVLAACGAPKLTGTSLGDNPAPAFTLTDLRGRVVVLSFLYTTCPDVCPIIAHKMGQVHDELGKTADEVAFVAITVDPEHDTVERVKQYLDAQGLDGKLTFLTGNESTLRKVWKEYYVGVTSGTNSTVIHGASVYLVDKQGREREALDQDFATGDLLHDVKALADE